MTPNRAELGAVPSPGRRYVVTLDDNLSPALASALNSTVVTTTGWWILPAAGGQSIVVLREA